MNTEIKSSNGRVIFPFGHRVPGEDINIVIESLLDKIHRLEKEVTTLRIDLKGRTL